MTIKWELGWMGEVTFTVPPERVKENVEALILLGFQPEVSM